MLCVILFSDCSSMTDGGLDYWGGNKTGLNVTVQLATCKSSPQHSWRSERSHLKPGCQPSEPLEPCRVYHPLAALLRSQTGWTHHTNESSSEVIKGTNTPACCVPMVPQDLLTDPFFLKQGGIKKEKETSPQPGCDVYPLITCHFCFCF